MTFLSWFDNRTLFSCQLLLASVFSVVFLGVRRANPELRGIGSIVLSFLVGVPGILLLFLRGAIPDFLSMTVANTLVLASFTLQYHAIIRFFGVKRPIYPIIIANLATLSVVFYYSAIEHNIAVRIIVASIVIAYIRALMAIELLRNARDRTDIRIFGIAMVVFTLFSCARAVVCLFNGAPSNYMQTGPFQTIAMGGDVFYICLLGLFFFTMINSEILAQIRDQSEQDSLSGALNRRGIELKLAIELKRIERNKQKLSIALIDIDYFKTINDTSGHAAGDNALRKVVRAISVELRAYDFLGRFGGDEFLLVLPQTSCADALIVAERIGNAVRTFSNSGKTPSITLSIGLSEALPGEHSMMLLGRADKALYDAKRAGRNCARMISPSRQPSEDSSLYPLIDNPVPSPEAKLIQSQSAPF
jgi:diguanylate cyclase (GGDEF)-like protein